MGACSCGRGSNLICWSSKPSVQPVGTASRGAIHTPLMPFHASSCGTGQVSSCSACAAAESRQGSCALDISDPISLETPFREAQMPLESVHDDRICIAGLYRTHAMIVIPSRCNRSQDLLPMPI